MYATAAFLLENGALYHIAHSVALLEYLITLYFKPEWKQFPYISLVGAPLNGHTCAESFTNDWAARGCDDACWPSSAIWCHDPRGLELLSCNGIPKGRRSYSSD